MNNRREEFIVGMSLLIIYLYAMTLGVVFGNLAYISFLITGIGVFIFLIYRSLKFAKGRKSDG